MMIADGVWRWAGGCPVPLTPMWRGQEGPAGSVLGLLTDGTTLNYVGVEKGLYMPLCQSCKFVPFNCY